MKSTLVSISRHKHGVYFTAAPWRGKRYPPRGWRTTGRKCIDFTPLLYIFLKPRTKEAKPASRTETAACLSPHKRRREQPRGPSGQLVFF